jgi:hypothetical protein
MFLPLAVWIPAIAICIEWLRRDVPGWIWFCTTALCMAMPIHVGFPQLVVVLYGLFAGTLLALLLARTICRRKACQAVAAMILGVSFGFPVLWQQLQFAKRVEKKFDSVCSAKPGLAAMFLPVPLVTAAPPFDLLQRPDFTHFYFFGGILAICWAAGALLATGGSFAAWDTGPRLYWWMALVFLALSIGDEAGLWRCLGLLPVVKIVVRYPIRMLPFFVFAVVVSGGFVFDRLWLRLCQFPAARTGVAASIFALIGYHLTQVDTGVGYVSFKPYPQVPCIEQLQGVDSNLIRRVCALAPITQLVPHRHERGQFARSLGANIAAVHGIFSLNFYDPMAESLASQQQAIHLLKTNAQASLASYGVQWIIVDEADLLSARAVQGLSRIELILYQRSTDTLAWPVYCPWGEIPMSEFGETISHLSTDNDHSAIACGDLRWFITPSADAMAFRTDSPSTGIRFHAHTEGVDVDLANISGGDVVVNFLRRNDMIASVDGRDTACRADDWGRILVTVPDGASRLAIRCRPKWATGIWLALAVAGIAVVGFAWAKTDAPTCMVS